MAKFVPYYGGYGGKMSSGKGWGGEPPKAKILKEFKKQTGVPKGMGNKMKKLEKSAKKSGF